jgi:hypothetical protein
MVHRTVRWANGRPRNPRVTRGRANGLMGGTGLSGEPTFSRANDRPRNPRVTRDRANGLMGAPDSVRCANGSKSSTVGCAKLGRRSAPDSEQGMSGGAPDCPVHHPTEGKYCLPRIPPTAPSCLGAIKGTSRRMEEKYKHSLIISKNQDFILAHLILCDSNLSSSWVENSVCELRAQVATSVHVCAVAF